MSEIRLRIICINPPPDVYNGKPAEFGLQDKAGNLTTGQPIADGALRFECVLKASGDNPPNFIGNYAQGTPKERFVYLSYRLTGETEWIKRIKVMLGSITAEQVAQDKTLEITVDGSRAARFAASWNSL